ncbi:cytidylyltransferase domain-containing protein, partial [Escherichia coli]|uniref:cytidylyltransferase domain-containing protein n=1 Tax=Escherichia coli TaxID=562 RepID=UPI003D03B06C
MRTKIIAIIPARSGSKGLRNKNALMLIDKPLLAYTIEAALQSEMFEKVIVTTAVSHTHLRAHDPSW